MEIISELEVSYNPRKIAGCQITNSKKTYELILVHWNWQTIELMEEVKVIYLNRNHEIIGMYSLAKGGISACTIDMRIILGIALKSLATLIIMVHSHPSRNLVPSQSDKADTKNLKRSV